MNVNKQGPGGPIAVFDSGVGGLPYLLWLKQNLPAERFVYLADRANFPYGEKSEQQLRMIITETVGRYIAAQRPKMMVIACNTASVTTLADLRRTYKIPFVGVVPAVKPAAEMSRAKSIGIFATRRTVEDPYTQDLIQTYARDCRVSRYAGVEIVELVENRFFNTSGEEKRRILAPAVDFFLERKVDAVVIACTHFIFVEPELREMLGPEVRIIDSREGVGRQTIHVLQEQQLQVGESQGQYRDGNRFYITRDEDEERYRRFAAEHGLQWGGKL